MHAWLCENPIGVEALQWKELPTPVPKAGEVLIAIKAASLNFPDLLTVQNKYQFKPPLPFVPGSEYAGVVEAVGEGVDAPQGRRPGRRHRLERRLRHPRLRRRAGVHAPADGLRLRRRLGLRHDLRHDRTTRWSTARSSRPARRCSCSARPAASARRRSRSARSIGARVIAAASSDEKCELCKSLGADATINYSAAATSATS